MIITYDLLKCMASYKAKGTERVLKEKKILAFYSNNIQSKLFNVGLFSERGGFSEVHNTHYIFVTTAFLFMFLALTMVSMKKKKKNVTRNECFCMTVKKATLKI